MDELRKAMRKAGCKTPFINKVTQLLRNEEIDWSDTYVNDIQFNEVSLRLMNGYVIKIRE